MKILMSSDSDSEFLKHAVGATIHIAAQDEELIKIRTDLAKFTAQTFSDAAQELHASDHLTGPGGAKHDGSDETAAMSLLLQIANQLVSASTDLFVDGRQYAAAALVRQLVEIEYLAWAFECRDRDAERWLHSTKSERQSFFTPAKLRKAAKGKFRGKDYGYHCELGGHPVPGSNILLKNDSELRELLLADLLGHTGRIWEHLNAWAKMSSHGESILKRYPEMLARYMAWKNADPLASLPPPP